MIILASTPTVVLTSTVTVLTGVLIFVLGQIFVRAFLDPIMQQRQTVGEIAYSLGYFRNMFKENHESNISDEMKKE